MATRVKRQTVDLTPYHDLVVIYLGMRVHGCRGLQTLIGFGKPIHDSAAAKPDGLLLHENIVWSLIPPHVGMRHYWRDWVARALVAVGAAPALVAGLPARQRTGFWHETYFRRGGFEAVYDDMRGSAIGMPKFAPVVDTRGPMFGARKRLRLAGEAPPAAVSEDQLYFGV